MSLASGTDADLVAERYRFLLTASTMLSAALDYGSALEALGRAAVPALGEACLIDMIDPSGTWTRAGARGADIELTAVMEAAVPAFEPSHPALRALQTGEAVLCEACTEHQLVVLTGSAEAAGMIAGRDLRRSLSVPIVGRHCMGALTLLGSSGSEHHGWSQMVPQIADDLARRAALSLDNARLFEINRDMAVTLQKSLMPAGLPSIPGMDLAACYHAGGEGAEVGGDFYDVFPTGDQSWAAVIGDVCGKGAEAAAVSSLARHTIRAANVELRKPSRILAFLNQLMISYGHTERFVTVAYCRIRRDGESFRLTLGSAGHPPSMLLRSDGSVCPQGRPGTLIGVTADISLSDQSICLWPGDCLVMYTDGVTEARGAPGRFGQRGLQETLARCVGMGAREIAGRLERTVLEFQTELSRDDMAILVIKMAPAEDVEGSL